MQKNFSLFRTKLEIENFPCYNKMKICFLYFLECVFMRKILVAGAGHGGLSAAYELSKAGYDVTVVEAKKREDLGYDWDDCLWMPAFKNAGIVLDDEKYIHPYFNISYVNPNKSTKIVIPGEPRKTLLMCDRKYLLSVLIGRCEEVGTKFIFDCKINGVIADITGVKGFSTEQGDMFGDLVIDAAGIDSPIRSTLPARSGIVNHIPQCDTFYTFRAYYENTDGFSMTPPQAIYFYHCYRPGMDWVVADDNFIDILVGSFSPLSQEEIDEAVEDFRQEYPSMGKLIRGGTVQKIPLSKPISKFIWNGYAAIGDSCSMIDPLSGSGITRCIDAGLILAKTVIGAKEQDCSQEILWDYQRTYMRYNTGVYTDNILRVMLSSLNGKQMDYFFEKEILTAKELGTKSAAGYGAKEIIDKVMALAPQVRLIPAFATAGKKLLSISKVNKLMPKRFDKSAFEKWQTEYNKL